jgi:hypothetical protein
MLRPRSFANPNGPTARRELRPDLRSHPYGSYLIFFRYVGDGIDHTLAAFGSRVKAVEEACEGIVQACPISGCSPCHFGQGIWAVHDRAVLVRYAIPELYLGRARRPVL